MHTLILWGFSAMLETCLRGKWRSTKRNACRHPFLLRSPTPSPPPRALQLCLQKQKKWRKLNRLQRAHTQKKTRTTLHSPLRWRIRSVQYVYVRSILFAVCPLCSLCIHTATASPSRNNTNTNSNSNNNKYVNEFAWMNIWKAAAGRPTIFS